MLNPFLQNPNYNQQDAMFLALFITTDAVNVSGGSSAHHQEHITVHTASGIVKQYCCLLLFLQTLYMFQVVPLSIIRST